MVPLSCVRAGSVSTSVLYVPGIVRNGEALSYTRNFGPFGSGRPGRRSTAATGPGAHDLLMTAWPSLVTNLHSLPAGPG